MALFLKFLPILMQYLPGFITAILALFGAGNVGAHIAVVPDWTFGGLASSNLVWGPFAGAAASAMTIDTLWKMGTANSQREAILSQRIAQVTADVDRMMESELIQSQSARAGLQAKG